MSLPNFHEEQPTFDADQIRRYLKRIQYPEDFSSQLDKLDLLSYAAVFQSSPLDNLKTILRHQLAAVPFDNLVLHYTQHHTVSLHAEALFRKFVVCTENGLGNRGGYCMENNKFLAIVLRSLGYDVLTCGARVSHAATGIHDEGFYGWYVQHVLLIYLSVILFRLRPLRVG
jgi:arylamine N-acetyltransferase